MSGVCAINLMTEPVVGVHLAGQRQRAFLTLPGVLAGLAGDVIEDFPALRPHQRHPWHAFTVQLAAMALHRAGVTEPPTGQDAWAALLRGLTPDWPDDAPWCLVAPPDQPAFMQPPVPGGDLSDYKPDEPLVTPDALDMLATSKNHDLKSQVMIEAQPEDWLFALITCQTANGGLSGSYRGISRMNGDYGSRNCVSICSERMFGWRFLRDAKICLAKRPNLFHFVPDFCDNGGVRLLWIRPWNGHNLYMVNQLDPLYIEICRRVRLAFSNAGIVCYKAKNKQLIGPGFFNGVTGDPWAPVNRKETKAEGIPKSGYNYQIIKDYMFSEILAKPLLLEIHDSDPPTGLNIIACGVARSQGKTEGYHERVVPVSKRVVRLLRAHDTDALAGWAKQRVEDAGTIRGKVLRPALFALLQDGPEEINFRAGETSACADRFLDRLDRAIDARFFDDLWQEAEVADGGEDARMAVRFEWHRWLAAQARGLLVEAADAVPHASMRRYRARVRAESLFDSTLHKHFPHLKKERKGDVA